MSVQKYPTIMLFPANDKQNPLTYTGDHDAAALEAFLNRAVSAVPSRGIQACLCASLREDLATRVPWPLRLSKHQILVPTKVIIQLEHAVLVLRSSHAHVRPMESSSA